MNCNIPGFPVLPHLPEFAQTHVHWVSDVIQPALHTHTHTHHTHTPPIHTHTSHQHYTHTHTHHTHTHHTHTHHHHYTHTTTTHTHQHYTHTHTSLQTHTYITTQSPVREFKVFGMTVVILHLIVLSIIWYLISTYFRTGVLKLPCASESPGNLSKIQLPGHYPCISDS